MPTTEPAATRHSFPETRWSLVLSANRESTEASKQAIETICQSYWFPLYAFVRRSGRSQQDAQDLTQEFFLRLLEKGWLESADRDRGRLRTFLITAMKRLMGKEWRKMRAQKRAGLIRLLNLT